MATTGRRGRRQGDGAPWASAPASARFLRYVSARLDALVADVGRLGITCRVTLGWSTDHRHLIVRCLVLRSGVADEREREAASFAGGYLAHALADLAPKLQWPGAGQNLVIRVPREFPDGARLVP